MNKQKQEKHTRCRIHTVLEREFGSCTILETLEDTGGWFQIVVQVPYVENDSFKFHQEGNNNE